MAEADSQMDDAVVHEPDLNIWLNAFKCVRPTDEFCADLGRQIVSELMRSRNPDRSVGAAPYAVTVSVVAS